MCAKGIADSNSYRYCAYSISFLTLLMHAPPATAQFVPTKSAQYSLLVVLTFAALQCFTPLLLLVLALCSLWVLTLCLLSLVLALSSGRKKRGPKTAKGHKGLKPTEIKGLKQVEAEG